MPSIHYLILAVWLLSLSLTETSTPSPTRTRRQPARVVNHNAGTSNTNNNNNKTPSFNLTTAQAVQKQVRQILDNGTETKPTFFFTNVGPNSFEYRGMFSPGKAPSLDFHKSFADFFDNFPKFPNLQIHTHTVIDHRKDAHKQAGPPVTPPPTTRTVSYPVNIPSIPPVPTVPPIRSQTPPKPRRVQKPRPSARSKPPVSYRHQPEPQPQPQPPPNDINVNYYQPEPPIQPNPPTNVNYYQPEPPKQHNPPTNVNYYQPEPPKQPNPPTNVNYYQPEPPKPPTNPFLYQQPQPPQIVYHNQIPPIPTPPPAPIINPPNGLTHLLQQQPPPFDLYRLTVPNSNPQQPQPILGNNGFGLNGLTNGLNHFQNHFVNQPLPRIDSPNSVQQHGGPQRGQPEDGVNPFQFPFAFPEYHIVRGQDRAESYPKIFRFEDGRTNIVEFERNKKRFRKRKGERVATVVDANTDPLNPDRVNRDQFLILHGGFFRHNDNEITKVNERYAERFTSFYYDSNELQDNAASSRTTVTETPNTPTPSKPTKPKGFGYRI